MREIKFKAWMDEAKYVTKPFTLETKPNNVFDSDIIMQFTGLKDRNGVEIYDQHIIIAPPTKHFPYKRKGIIMMAVNGLYFKPIDNTVGDYVCKYSPTFIMNSEIIGNIYENPELLKPTLSCK